MKQNSLGRRTDLFFLKFDGTFTQHNDHTVIKTPNNPNFYYGNLLLLNGTPTPNQQPHLESLFKKTFKDQPQSTHITLAWDQAALTDSTPKDTIKHYTSLGYNYDNTIVLTANKNDITPPKHTNSQITINPITTDQQWADMLALQILCRDPIFNHDEYIAFATANAQAWRRITQKGHGQWLGAYKNNTLVASSGIFHFDELARFQAVSTHPDHRKQGICQTLIHHICNHAFQNKNTKTLVMQADEDYHAARIYQSLGFKPTHRLTAFCKYSQKD